MVMLVWFILSLFGVCHFTWLPVFIDALISGLVLATRSSDGDDFINNFLSMAVFSVAAFAFYKFFFGLTISTWWIFASPIAFIIMLFVPGGVTIVNLLFKKWAFISLPIWGLIVGIVLDVAVLVLFIPSIIDSIKSKECWC